MFQAIIGFVISFVVSCGITISVGQTLRFIENKRSQGGFLFKNHGLILILTFVVSMIIMGF